MTVDTNEQPHIERGHQLTAHGSDSHRHKVVWIIIGIVLLVACSRVGMAPLQCREKSRAPAAEDHGYNRDGYER